jgi:hypothetical protein
MIELQTISIMKKKEIIIGIIAIILVTGSTIASSQLAIAKYVKAGVPLTCRAIVDVDCGLPNSLVCRVIIEGTTYQAYQDAACISTITGSPTFPIHTQFE